MEITDVIIAAGSISENIQQISTNEDGTFFIRTKDNGFLLHVIGPRVVFESVIDTEIGVNRARILGALLTYNVVWKDTGFVRMALTGSGATAEAMLIADIFLDDTFTDQYVANVIEDLDAKIQVWRDIIAGGADDGSDIYANENSVRV